MCGNAGSGLLISQEARAQRAAELENAAGGARGNRVSRATLFVSPFLFLASFSAAPFSLAVSFFLVS